MTAPAAGGWRIRLATLDDAPAIAEVGRAGWRETYRDIIDPVAIERFLAGAYTEASMRRRIGLADMFQVAQVAEASGSDGAVLGVVGFAEWARRERHAELVATYLLAPWQRHGIGRAFHAAALERYRGAVDSIVTHVVRDNHGALGYYRAMGFVRETPTVFDLFGEQIAELRLELSLRCEA